MTRPRSKVAFTCTTCGVEIRVRGHIADLARVVEHLHPEPCQAAA